MQITATQEKDILLLALTGRLDAFGAPQLRQRLDEAIAEGQVRLIVDLSEVALVDSSGLGALVGGLKRVRQNGGDLKLVGLQPTARIVFELTRLDRAFDIADDVKAALVAFAA